MTDPSKPPAFPAFGVTRAGEALDPSAHPSPPQTAPVDPDRVAALTAAPVGEPDPSAEAAEASILLLDDDFFGAMDLADALAAATGGDIRSAVSEQKAAALIDEARPTFAVLAVTTPGAASVAAQLTALTIPFALLTETGDAGPAARAHPTAPVLSRGVSAVAIRTELAVFLRR